MKKILITGAGSYIGVSFEKYIASDKAYSADTLDMRTDAWRTHDFSGYDCVFHVAGIVHDTGRKNDALYYAVNRDLAVETAVLARNAGVKQFVFMSSMSIYNGCGLKKITEKTVPRAKGSYADSKLRADIEIQKLNSGDFKTAVLRPPMVYGPGCKGNYPRLVKLALAAPFFPDIKNERSMIYIDNLCEIVRLIIENDAGGVFFPQNGDFFCTSDLVKNIAKANGKKIAGTRIFNWAVWLLYPFSNQIRKLFGNLTYDMQTSSHFGRKYVIVSNAESIIKGLSLKEKNYEDTDHS